MPPILTEGKVISMLGQERPLDLHGHERHLHSSSSSSSSIISSFACRCIMCIQRWQFLSSSLLWNHAAVSRLPPLARVHFNGWEIYDIRLWNKAVLVEARMPYIISISEQSLKFQRGQCSTSDTKGWLILLLKAGFVSKWCENLCFFVRYMIK